MSPDCRNDCAAPPAFPRPIDVEVNPPARSRLRYRIGTYSDIRAFLLGLLDRDPVLRAWTHREPDDPGIALLEGAAVLGDILTFYQELYANEAFLRTATWRESVADLVRLTGYRLAPGVGGRSAFAFEVKGDSPVRIPAGLPVKAQLEDVDPPADFETTDTLTAHPPLSRFRLYRPRVEGIQITTGLDRLEIEAVDGRSDPAGVAGHGIEEGDRLLLMPDAEVFDTADESYETQTEAEVVVVDGVEQVLDRIVVRLRGSLRVGRGDEVTAYRLGRTFRHFGHNSPSHVTSIEGGTNGTDAQPQQTPTDFQRDIDDTDTPSGDTEYYPTLHPRDIPLARQVDDLAAGALLICQGRFERDGADDEPLTVARRIDRVRADSLVWGNLSGPSTVVRLEDKLIVNDSIGVDEVDIRTLEFHETVGRPLTLRAPAEWDAGPFVEPLLNFYGTHDAAAALAGRRLLLQREDGVLAEATVSNEPAADPGDRDEHQRWLWPVALDELPETFVREDFDEVSPRVTVSGNVVDATQGKTEKEAVLGNGDARQRFQTFKLPKAPLTHHVTAGETPPETPELEVFVDGRRWTRVPTLFGRGPTDQVYIVRQDANGESWVQFGDGKTGKRLPSGVKNVVARYRTGVGAHGPLKPDTSPQAGRRVDRLRGIGMPGVVSGGEPPESGDKAREAAPGKVQSLGRLVSLQDFESEALAVAGVAKALARWALVENVPSVVLTVLMETGRGEELEAVRGTLEDANRCRGTRRFPVEVVHGRREFLHLAANVALDPALRPNTVLSEVRAALGVMKAEDDGDASEGLFALRDRRFGQDEYVGRIEAVIQNVEGVRWVEVTALQSLGDADDPTELDVPTTPAPAADVPCAADRILALFEDHIELTPASAPDEEAC